MRPGLCCEWQVAVPQVEAWEEKPIHGQTLIFTWAELGLRGQGEIQRTPSWQLGPNNGRGLGRCRNLNPWGVRAAGPAGNRWAVR